MVVVVMILGNPAGAGRWTWLLLLILVSSRCYPWDDDPSLLPRHIRWWFGVEMRSKLGCSILRVIPPNLAYFPWIEVAQHPPSPGTVMGVVQAGWLSWWPLVLELPTFTCWVILPLQSSLEIDWISCVLKFGSHQWWHELFCNSSSEIRNIILLQTMYANSKAMTTTCILQSESAVQQQTEDSAWVLMIRTKLHNRYVLRHQNYILLIIFSQLWNINIKVITVSWVCLWKPPTETADAPGTMIESMILQSIAWGSLILKIIRFSWMPIPPRLQHLSKGAAPEFQSILQLLHKSATTPESSGHLKMMRQLFTSTMELMLLVILWSQYIVTYAQPCWW